MTTVLIIVVFIGFLKVLLIVIVDAKTSSNIAIMLWYKCNNYFHNCPKYFTLEFLRSTLSLSMVIGQNYSWKCVFLNFGNSVLGNFAPQVANKRQPKLYSHGFVTLIFGQIDKNTALDSMLNYIMEKRAYLVPVSNLPLPRFIDRTIPPSLSAKFR